METSKLEKYHAAGYPVDKFQDAILESVAYGLGYQISGYGMVYPDKSKGIAFEMGDTMYNNGLYMLHLTNEGQYLVEVIEPNTADRGPLVERVAKDAVIKLDEVIPPELNVYDMTQIIGHIVSQIIVMRIANNFFPGDARSQFEFEKKYYPKFMFDTILQHLGSYLDQEAREEEAVNAEPFVIKMMMESLSEQDGESNDDEREDT